MSTGTKFLSATENKKAQDVAKTSAEILKNHIPKNDAAKPGDANVDNEEIKNILEKLVSKVEKHHSNDSHADTKVDKILQNSQHSEECILITNDETKALRNETRGTGNKVSENETTGTGNEISKNETAETEVLKSETTETEVLKNETTETEVLKSETTGTGNEVSKSETTGTGTEALKSETTGTGNEVSKSETTGSGTEALKSETTGTGNEECKSETTGTGTEALKSETTATGNEVSKIETTGTEVLKSETAGTETEALKCEITARIETGALKCEIRGTETETLKCEITAGIETGALKCEIRGKETEKENINSFARGFAVSDDENLQHISPAFDDEGNLKEPFIGFSETHKAKFFSLVDSKSLMIFELLNSLEDQLMEENFASLLAHKDSLVVPRDVLLFPKGGDINLRVFKDGAPKNTDPSDRASNKPKEVSEGLRSPKRVRPLLLPFLEGWKRKILVETNSSSGRKTGDVYYVSPNNVKCWSMGQVAQFLSQYPSLELTVKNFSFAKLPLEGFTSGEKSFAMKVGICDDMDDDFDKKKYGFAVKSSSSRRLIQPPKRYATGHTVVCPEKKTKISSKNVNRNADDSIMEMGMLPPKYPKDKILSPATDLQQPRRRGRPPNPGGKADLRLQAQAIAAANEASGITSQFDDINSMFQISAFRHYHLLMEQYQNNTQENMESDSEEYKNPAVEENSLSSCIENSEQLLLCSIRCSGMAGETPTLQCKRCLCFYHPECLGLPPNLRYNSFLCSNCEGESATEHQMNPSTQPFKANPKQSEAKKPSLVPKKMGVIKKPLPPLKSANFPKFPPFVNDNRFRLPPLQNARPPVLQPAMSFGKMRMMPKLTPPPLLQLSRPVSSESTMSISPISMKHGSGRPSTNSKHFPHLLKHLTVTPFPVPKKNRVPTIPNLYPVAPVKNLPTLLSKAKPAWLCNNLNKATLGSKAMANIKSSAAGKNKESPMNKIDKPSGTILQILQQIKKANKKKSKTEVDNSTFPPVFRRDIQGCVIIGHNKFVVVPRNSEESFKSPRNAEESLKSPTNAEESFKSPTPEAECSAYTKP